MVVFGWGRVGWDGLGVEVNPGLIALELKNASGFRDKSTHLFPSA